MTYKNLHPLEDSPLQPVVTHSPGWLKTLVSLNILILLIFLAGVVITFVHPPWDHEEQCAGLEDQVLHLQEQMREASALLNMTTDSVSSLKKTVVQDNSRPQPPAELSCVQLRDWLRTQWFVGRHTSLGYTEARHQLYSFIDNENNQIEGVYSGYIRRLSFGEEKCCSNVMPINLEHTVPQSFFGKKEPMVSDMFHMFPSYSKANGKRSDHPFAEISTSNVTVYLSDDDIDIPPSNVTEDERWMYSAYDSVNRVFEPRYVHKGNVARSVLYFYTVYPDYDITEVAEVDLLLRWALMDQVDSKERTRNDLIESVQGNRNFFVDFPQWAKRAWECEVR